MNSLKKSATSISHDSARRSSLPLGCLDVHFSESSFYDLTRKIKLSPVEPPDRIGGKFHVPQIVFGDNTVSGSSTLSVSGPLCNKNLFELYPRTSSPYLNSHLQTRRKSLNSTSGSNNFNLGGRRASCGPNFPIGSLSPDLSVFENCIKCLSNSKISDHCRWKTKSSFDDKQDCKKSRDNSDESLSSRNQSILHLPSLSPCYEDKAKLNSWDKAEEEHYFSFKDIGIFTERNSRERRASFHSSVAPSPRFPHVGVFWCQDTKKFRRNSISHIPVSNLLDKESQRPLKSIPRNLCSISVPQNDNVIGKGGFGKVKVGLWKGEKVAVKILAGKKVTASIQSEKNALHIATHPGIVETYALVSPCSQKMAKLSHKDKNKDQIIEMSELPHMFGISDSPNFSFRPDDSWAWVISELCTPLNLLKVINSSITLNDYDVVRILQQIAMALSHIHKSGYVHLDVKPSNCFLTQTGNVKLGDFGCLTKINEIPYQVIGTVAYQAPEVLKGENVTDRVDVFSLSITAWQLLTSETPYNGFHPHVIIYKVTRANHRPSTDLSIAKYSLIQKILFTVIEKCWSQHPEERPSANSLCRIFASLLCSAEQTGQKY